MKRFFKRYMYHFILAAIIIGSLSVGFMLGKLDGQAVNTETDNALPVVYVPTVKEKTNLGEFKITAYCTCEECCGEYSDGMTATMTEATPGRTIAVDPDVIPYGTVVEINGEQYVAEDCGGAIVGNHIDILCASHELAESYGVQYATVYIITK